MRDGKLAPIDVEFKIFLKRKLESALFSDAYQRLSVFELADREVDTTIFEIIKYVNKHYGNPSQSSGLGKAPQEKGRDIHIPQNRSDESRQDDNVIPKPVQKRKGRRKSTSMDNN